MATLFRIACAGALLCLLALPESAFGQRTGTLWGRITDASTGESLPGATVSLLNSSRGTASDLDGSYQLNRLPAGQAAIRVSYIGYKPQTLDVTILAGESLERNIQLELDVLVTEEVLVTAQAEGQVAAINQQIASNTIVNVVSAARIQELPDANVAESVGRLPGISLQRDAGEGQQVVIRGLAPEFARITINGEQVPATELDGRGVDLSMVAPEMLDGIEVYKAATPDRDADAVAGTVNLSLRNAPQNPTLSLRTRGSFTSQQNELGPFKADLSASRRFFEKKLGVLATASFDRADRSSDVFNAEYFVKREALEDEIEAPIAISQLNLNDRLETRDRYGLSTVFDYTWNNNHKILATNLLSWLDREETRRDKIYSVNLFTVYHRYRERDINVGVATSSLQGSHNLGAFEVDWRASRSSSLQKTPFNHRTQFTELSAFFDANVNDEAGPDQIPGTAKNELAETYLNNGRFETERAEERDYAGALDFTIPLQLSANVNGHIKLGGKYLDKLRNADENQTGRSFHAGIGNGPLDVIEAFGGLTQTTDGRIAISDFLGEAHDFGDFLDGQYDINVSIDRAMTERIYELMGPTYRITPSTNFNDYEYRERISAGYLLTELHITPRLMLLPGIRVEHTETEYTAVVGTVPNDDSIALDLYDPANYGRDTTATNTYTEWFPMVQLRYRIRDGLDVRLARTRTLTRPSYNLLSPGQLIRVSGIVTRGAPQANPTTATNYDVFLSAYGNKIGLLTAGVFLKELDDLLYLREKTILDPEAENLPLSTRGFDLIEPVNNNSTTTVRGFEIEWQANLAFMPPPFNGLVFYANYARIFSETRYPRTIVERQTEPPFRIVQVDTFRVGRMPSQASHIANFSLGYDLKGFSGRISMLYQGASLTTVGDRFEVDGFTEAYIRFDASLKQRLSPQLSLFLNLNNLTDRPDRSFQNTAGFPTAQEYYGWSVDLGAQLKF